MIRTSLLLVVALNCFAMQDAWDPDDDSFDPGIHSVVIGDASWIGDPSPLIHVKSQRTGYTHVHATNYEGMDPAVQISLMFPLAAGETEPVAGGMLMLSDEQTKAFKKSWSEFIQAPPDEKLDPVGIKTALPQMKWVLSTATEGESRFIQLENETEKGVSVYRFKINAAKKLLGAIEHSHGKLSEKK